MIGGAGNAPLVAERLPWGARRVREVFRWFYRYRSIRLTSDGLRFLLLTLAVGLAALNTGNNLLYLLLAMMLSLIVMSGILSEQSLKHLAIHRRAPSHIFAGRPATLALTLTNRKHKLPTFSLRVMDLVAGAAVDRGIHLLHLSPQASVTQTYSLLVPRRGMHHIEGVKLLTRFPFGLFVKAATLPLASDLVIYPESKPVPQNLIQDLVALGHEQAVLRRGQGIGLYNLREYQYGDESRTIHWKTSARRASLIVRETEAEDQRQVTLVLPTAAPEHRQHFFEEAVVLIASIAAYFLERDFAVRLLVGNQEILHGTGNTQLHRILRVLALCDPTPAVASDAVPEPFFRLAEQTLRGELTILVLPWMDPRVTEVCGGVSRILEAWEYP